MSVDYTNIHHIWKLKDWVNTNNLSWFQLLKNKNAMRFIEENYGKINISNDNLRFYLSQNPSSIYLLEKNKKLIDWDIITSNWSANYFLNKQFIPTLDGNIKYNVLLLNDPSKLLFIENAHLNDWVSLKIDWSPLSKDTKESSIRFLENNPNKIDWKNLSSNPAAIHLLEANINKINWKELSTNPAAVYLLEQNPNKINWENLSKNNSPIAIHILEQNIDKICWRWLSENSSAIYLLEKYQNQIDWKHLSLNPSAFHLLKNNPDKIDWKNLSKNKGLCQFDSNFLKENQDKIYWEYLSNNPDIFEVDIDFFHKRINIIRKELMEKTWHPSRFREWCLSVDELNELT